MISSQETPWALPYSVQDQNAPRDMFLSTCTRSIRDGMEEVTFVLFPISPNFPPQTNGAVTPIWKVFAHKCKDLLWVRIYTFPAVKERKENPLKFSLCLFSIFVAVRSRARCQNIFAWGQKFFGTFTHTEHMIEREQENKRTRKVEEEALLQNPFPWPQARDDEGDVELAKLILVYAFNNLL